MTATEGFILGVGAKMFTIAGLVLVFGISSSVVYGLILWILSQMRQKPVPFLKAAPAFHVPVFSFFHLGRYAFSCCIQLLRRNTTTVMAKRIHSSSERMK